jgi:type II secretory pathway pseudopilin PulG
MTRRMIAVLVAAAVVALSLGATAPRADAGMSFVDKQVMAGALLIQKYVNDYGQANRFTYPPVTMVKQGGRLPGSTFIWPSNPWTGKVMGPGKSRGTYTYTLKGAGSSYILNVHLSRGNQKLTGGVPAWFKPERDTQSRQNLLLLQRYVEAFAAGNGGTYPTADLVNATAFAAPAYVWPQSPWSGAAMTQGTKVGEFSYVQLSGGTGYALKVMLSNGRWSTPLGPLSALSRLTATPGA